MEPKKKRGFSAMDPEERRRIASAGGIARGNLYKRAREERRPLNNGSVQPTRNAGQ